MARRVLPSADRVRAVPAALAGPFQAFFALQSAGGIVLLLCAAAAIVWANSPAAGSYVQLWQTVVTVGGGPLVLSKPLLLWINDGLMAIFFFVVGLEIKREMLVGELSSPRKALLPIVAAAGGMAAPAVIYALLNAGRPGAPGWGIPMATDIAFALGVLALLGPRVPPSLRVFLTAVAIVDDLGAVLVIALFYTSTLAWGSLGAAALVLALLGVVNRMGVQRLVVYAGLGAVLWLLVLKSGVHATIAGVLLALTVPARRRIDGGAFLERARWLLDTFARGRRPGPYLSDRQRDAIHALEQACEDVQTPLSRLEHALHPWVAFAIMPVFALANAGVAVPLDLSKANAISVGILLGLVVGKQIGLFLPCWLLVRASVAAVPSGATWRQLYGMSLLGGIGFTMSLFIAGLAFGVDAESLDSAKIGVLAGSLAAGLLGYAVLFWTGSIGSSQR